MKKVILALFALVAALAISPAALAQSENFTININNNGIDFTGSGVISTLTTYPATNGGYGTATDGYLITSFTGSLTVAGGPTGDTVNLVLNPNPGGNSVIGSNQFDNLLFPTNDVIGAGTGFFNNSGILLLDSNDQYVNIFTGSTVSPGSAGLPYWVVINNNASNFSTSTDLGPRDAGVTVPEYGGLAMLILTALTLAGGFFFKVRQTGLFLAA